MSFQEKKTESSIGSLVRGGLPVNPQGIPDESIRALREFGSATVYEAQGAKGALDGGIKPVDSGMRLVGPAFTVDTYPADNLMIHYAMLKAQPGDVLVVDAKAFVEAGAWGDVMTAQALAMGLAGLVINGAVRDAAVIVESGFPVFCRGLSIKGTRKSQPGKINTPLCMGGVLINPGDIIVGDCDGVAVVARDELDEVIKKSRAREDKETALRAQLAQGANTVDLLGLRDVLRSFNLV